MTGDAERPSTTDAHRAAATSAEPDRGVGSSVSRVVVLGADHQAPGAAVTVPVGDRVAVGLARGWRPKPYAYVDPNEDAVAAVAGERAQLLVVADGHNGRRASHEAVQAVVDLLGDGPHPPDLSVERVVDVVAAVDDRVCVAPVRRGRTRTTLVVALRSRSVLQWASVGDSTLAVVADGRPRLLSTSTRWFVGDGLHRDAMLGALPTGTVDLPASAWVVLATDGYTDYLPRGLTLRAAVTAAVADADGPDGAVRAAFSQAREGGAGDNVGVVVSGPWYKPQGADHHILDPDG